MILQGIPEAQNASTTGYAVPDLALWPSVTAQPGAVVSLRRCLPCLFELPCLALFYRGLQ